MRCFDCPDPETGSPDTEAVALCRRCGAALCRQHLITLERSVHRPAGLGPATSPIPVRRILCSWCNRAGTAALH
ncbi:DUF2180 family protein [Streptomyces sp. T1317-0309]|nr:DUF2180 family protein [Streptomyces sp. T1317-0309]